MHSEPTTCALVCLVSAGGDLVFEVETAELLLIEVELSMSITLCFSLILHGATDDAACGLGLTAVDAGSNCRGEGGTLEGRFVLRVGLLTRVLPVGLAAQSVVSVQDGRLHCGS